MRRKHANKMPRPSGACAVHDLRRNAHRGAQQSTALRHPAGVPAACALHAQVGEWSLATTDCATYLNGFVQPSRSRWQGELEPYRQPFIASCAKAPFLRLERIDRSCLSSFQPLAGFPPFPRVLPLLSVGTNSACATRGRFVVGRVGSGRRAGPDPARTLRGVGCMRCLARSLYPRSNGVRMLRRTFGSCKGQNDSSTFTTEYRAFLRNFAAAQQAAYAGR